MLGNFTSFLLNQAWIKVIRVLLISSQKRCLRELVDLSGLSLAGVQDVLRRLLQQEIIVPHREQNKLFFSLNLTAREQDFLRQAVDHATQNELRARSEHYSQKRSQAVDWIDPQVQIWRIGRKQILGTTKAS